MEPARRRDALPTLALHRTVLAEDRWFVTRAEELGTTLEEREQQIRALEHADNGWFLVARRPGIQVAGFLVVDGGRLVRTRHVGRIELMVDPAHRRAGVGRALMADAIARAEASGVLEKLSLAVLADNEAAIALYRSLGFREEGRRIGEYLDPGGEARDDVLMARPVGGG